MGSGAVVELVKVTLVKDVSPVTRVFKACSNFLLDNKFPSISNGSLGDLESSADEIGWDLVTAGI